MREHAFTIRGDRVPIYNFPSDAKYRIEIDLPYPIGNLVSEIEYGVFVDVVCAKCGNSMFGKQWGTEPCELCGSVNVTPSVKGAPHCHGNWVLEVHILDEKVQNVLGEILGTEYDRQLRIYGKGSWHQFTNDGSGFDICHVRCLDKALYTRFTENISGLPLFMKLYPQEGKLLNGYGQNFKVYKYWVNGELRPISEYFVKKGIGCPVDKL